MLPIMFLDKYIFSPFVDHRRLIEIIFMKFKSETKYHIIIFIFYIKNEFNIKLKSVFGRSILMRQNNLLSEFKMI